MFLSPAMGLGLRRFRVGGSMDDFARDALAFARRNRGGLDPNAKSRRLW
jgi:hypothetical protein